MSDYTKDEIVAALFQALPYSQHISDIDTVKEPEAIRFTWRRDVWRISCSGSCEHVVAPFLEGDNASILMEELVKRQLTIIQMRKLGVQP